MEKSAPPENNLSGEVQELRRCLRDLVALTPLPALWEGLEPQGVAESLADALLSVLRLDLIYVRLIGSADGMVHEAARTGGRPGASDRAAEIGQALETCLRATPLAIPEAIPALTGEGMVRILCLHIGHSGEKGVIVIGSCRSNFPTETERLLGGIAANQVAVAMDNVRLFEAAQKEINERKQVEAALRESEERFRALVQQAVVGVAQTDLDRKSVVVNDRYCQMVGRSREVMLTLRMQDITHPDDLPDYLQQFRRLVAEGVDFVLEKRNVRPDGAYVWVRKHVSLVRDAAGHPQYAAVVNEDITERKRAEAEIADLNARLQRAVAESHHRIKNNLQILSSMVDMQRNNAQESVPKSELERLGTHILTLASLHDMLTSESKVNTESLDIVSLKTALEKLVPMLQTAAGGRRIVIRMEEDIVLPLKQGGSFILLVNELVSNAIKHGNGDVEVRLRPEQVWPPETERRKRPRARLELIESFGRWDLKGRIVFENRVEGGARVVVTFPLFESAEAVVNPERIESQNPRSATE